MTARCAIYYAPRPDDPLWSFGSEVIGYDAATGYERASQPAGDLDADGWRQATDDPRRYGFHATLKAPFELAAGTTVDQLVAAVKDFARQAAPAPVDGLQVAALGRFIALVPRAPSPELQRLALDVVTAFEPFRAPLSVADRARRMKGGTLSERQIAQLDRYGYPYVGDDFRFHMTLTGSLDDPPRAAVLHDLDVRFRQSVDEPVRAIDRIAVYVQPNRDARFVIAEAFTLG